MLEPAPRCYLSIGGKPVTVSSCSGTRLQSNLGDPDGWDSDVNQSHPVPGTDKSGVWETAEPSLVLSFGLARRVRHQEETKP